MKKTIFIAILAMAAAPIFAEDSSKVLKTEKARLSYAVGTMLGNNWQQQGLDIDPQMFARALKDTQSGGKSLMTMDESKAFLAEYQKTFATRIAEKNKIDGDAFLTKNKKEKGVVTLTDGLQYKVLTEGNGASPTANDEVTVNYRGTLLNGNEFDNSYKRGQPATFPVTGVIPGWTEALQKMKVGSKWQLFIPSDLAYGPGGRPGIPPNATLIFDVELLSIQQPTPPDSSNSSHPPLTSDIIKVPSAEEMKKGAKIETIKPEELQKMQSKTNK